MANLYTESCAVVDAALAAAGAVPQLFSSAVHPNYVWDPNCFAYGWRDALTCRAVKGFYNTRGGPTLIEEAGGDNRFAIVADHYFPKKTVNGQVVPDLDGKTAWHLGTDGVAREYPIAAYRQLPGTDIGVAMYASVPVNVIPAKLAPADLAAYLPQGAYRLPVVTAYATDGNLALRAGVEDINKVTGVCWIETDGPIAPNRLAFRANIVKGASGSPSFLVMPDGTLLLLFCWWSGANGPALHSNLAALTAAMTEMAGAPRAPVVRDLSAYDAIYTLPQITLSVSAAMHDPGSPVTVSWNVTGADTITVDPDPYEGQQPPPAQMDWIVYPAANTTYTVTATNYAGTSIATQAVLTSAFPGNAYYWRQLVDGNVANLNNYATTADGVVVPEAISADDTILWGELVNQEPLYGRSDANWYGNGDFGDAEIHGALIGLAGYSIGSGRFYGPANIAGGYSAETQTTLGPLNGAEYPKFYGPVQLHGNVDASLCEFYSDVMLYDGAGSVWAVRLAGAKIHHRVSVDRGATWTYSPESAAVAPANKVLADTSNVGVAGTLPVAMVMESAGGNLMPNSVLLDTDDGAAAGGTVDLAAAEAAAASAADAAARADVGTILQTALTAQGFTTGRAAKLELLGASTAQTRQGNVYADGSWSVDEDCDAVLTWALDWTAAEPDSVELRIGPEQQYASEDAITPLLTVACTTVLADGVLTITATLSETDVDALTAYASPYPVKNHGLRAKGYATTGSSTVKVVDAKGMCVRKIPQTA
jgi:hypothetical protein